MNRRNLKPVPSTRQVASGASVNIVLKEDQPTGRTVSGVVRDVLTRGNHPRGIKVRLADGRVGRVQTMATADQARTIAATSPQEDPVDGLAYGTQSTSGRFEDEADRRPRRQRGGWSPQQEEGDDVPSQQIGLDAYIKPAKSKQRGKGKAANTSAGSPENREQDDTDGGAPVEPSTSESLTVTCPVCGTFDGDEAAVAHHVASHFESEA